MKVLLCFTLIQILFVSAVTVPPNWAVSYNQQPIQQTVLPEFQNQFQYQSFIPKEITENFHIYHPSLQNDNTPQSYQFVHFNNFDKAYPIKQKIIPKSITQPIKQYLLEVPKNEHSIGINKKTEDTKEEVEENEKITELEVPTKPNYPGEGQWAKYGIKHKPYIRPEETTEESLENEEKPEGYDTFEKGAQQFNQAKTQFNHNLNTFPQNHQLEPSPINNDENSEPLYEKPEIGFVPEKLYAQVRKTDKTEFLPRSEIDPEQEENADRLREVIKDSKIHTVYIEEGYEDSAYDHAGHEKNAESHEGHSQVAESQKGSSTKPNINEGRKSDTNYILKQLENNKKKSDLNFDESEPYNKLQKHFTKDAQGSESDPIKNIKKIKLRNGSTEEIDMEIHTEIKYTPQKKKHKYVKIIPSTKKMFNSTNTPLKRVKRYDKEKLSKKYIRKRPSYYWKKIKTTTTERPLITSRKKFEAAFKTHGKSNFEELKQIVTNNKTTMKTTTTSTTPSTTSVTVTIPISSTTKLTTTTLNTKVLEEDIHDDLKNPELTTKSSKPSTPKMLPVKIRKFKPKRQKRYTNDFPDIKVELEEFVNVENLPNPTKKPDLTHIKYPYYNLPKLLLNKNSPLRYAEDMKNIPEKIENEMSFYESRNHIICPEVESDVNPIPERIENQKEGEETGNMAETPELPRLKGLGDKIDCLKVKYWDENPLDSPFFNEELIEDPIPLFVLNPQVKNENILNKSNIKRELKVKILEPIVVIDEELFESATVNPIHQNTKAVLKPPFTLLEMMKMNSEKIIKPNNIYDQIALIDNKENNNKETNIATDKLVIVYDNENVTLNMDKKISDLVLNATTLLDEFFKREDNLKNSRKLLQHKKPIDIIRKLPSKKILKPKVRTTTEFIPVTGSTNSTTRKTLQVLNTSDHSTTSSPTQLSSKLLPNKVQLTTVKPNNYLQSYIFDISKYLPQIPIYGSFSNGVQFKNINDVNINKNNKEINEEESKLSIITDINKEENSNSTKQIPDDSMNDQSFAETNISLKKKNYNDFYNIFGLNPLVHKIAKRNTKSDKKFKNEQNDLLMEETENVPRYFNYNHIRTKRRVKPDKYFYRIPDDDLLMEASENKPMYSAPPARKPVVYTEIRRTRPSHTPVEEDLEEEKDLNPRKRVYELKSQKSTTTEAYPILEEVVEEEIVETAEPSTTPEPRIYPVEANSQNPSIAEYIFFIEKLHEKWAKEDATSTTEAIPELTTEAMKTVVTQVVSEGVNERRGEPAYLQIINQLHQIKKEEEAKTEPVLDSTTTEHIQVSVKNSNPFIMDTFMAELNSMKAKLEEDNTAEGSTSPEISRSRNLIAKLKSSVDTSKYKTIERNPVNVRHNFSSRFNSEDQNLPLTKIQTTQTPMIIAIITRPQITTTSTNKPTEDYKKSTSDLPVEESTNKSVEEILITTARTRQRSRLRSRPTTTSTTTAPSTTNPLFRRRRPTRITTTTPLSTTKSEQILNRRRNRFKVEAQTQVPENHKNQTTPTTETKEEIVISTEEPKKQRRFQKVQERRVTSEVTLTRFFEPASDEIDENSEESRKHQYEIIGPLTHTEKGHGGNYKHEKDQKIPNNSEEGQTDTSQIFYYDPNLAVDVNHLKEPQNLTLTKTQSVNTLLISEENTEKVTQKPVHSKVSLYPNMARMVNRLAESMAETTTLPDDDETESVEEKFKPIFIKDPSRRMYYYAKL